MTKNQKIWLISIAAIMSLFFLLKPILAPFLFAAFLAYLGDPLVNRLMQLKLSRLSAAVLVFVIIMLLVMALFLFLIPLIIKQFGVFIARLPQFLLWLQTVALPWLDKYLDLTISLDPQVLKTVLTEHWQQAGNFAISVWQTLSQSGIAIIGWFAKVLIVPVVTFYLLCDWHKVVSGAHNLLPRRIEPTVMRLWWECDDVVSAFLRGQFLVMLVLAFVYWIGLAAIGLELALMLSVLAGLFSIVPYLGLIIGILSASIAAVVQFHDVTHVMYVLIVFTVGHLIESFVLVPLFVGDRIGLHPVAVIFAIFAGGHLFGFAGVLLALPVAAVLMVLLRHGKHHYMQSEIYKK